MLQVSNGQLATLNKSSEYDDKVVAYSKNVNKTISKWRPLEQWYGDEIRVAWYD